MDIICSGGCDHYRSYLLCRLDYSTLVPQRIIKLLTW